jgi:hypothetical protein
VASYPRQIPAGGEGNISIKVNTNGYGGRSLNKHINVFTNDPANGQITLNVTGKVLNFARLEPTYARLVGKAGTDIKKKITITRQKAYPFKVVGVKSSNGKEIEVGLKEFKQAGSDGYILTIQNKKATAGRYADRVILTTDSTVKPTITIPVYGQITSAVPRPEKAPSKTNPDNE